MEIVGGGRGAGRREFGADGDEVEARVGMEESRLVLRSML